ncbi:MAG: hypothetical protein EBS69_06735 [Verrucomicrobia bacterium]|nr:hypothetical protein [Verrucomicrobiota bacterium]NBS79239.1 hypothetical protein [bacterium]
MASPLNNPWVSGGLGAGILVYFIFTFTPQGWKEPIRNFFTGELKREGGKEPELQIGAEKLFRAVPQSGPGSIAPILARGDEAQQRLLFQEPPKGVEEKPVERKGVPEVPEGAGLLAVWMDGKTHVAVLTDGMVREGDGWGVFTVEKITPDSVTLRHEEGERVLRMGEVRARSQAGKVATAPAKASQPAAGSPEEQLQKVLDMQKSMDPAKLLQGFPQKILDSFMGKQKKAVETN